MTRVEDGPMTAIPNGSWLASLQPQPTRVTGEQYEVLPEEICRAIEIVDGYVVYSEAPSPAHQIAGRRLANLIERDARTAMSRGYECITVNTDVDLRLRDVPLLNRRPDVVLYRCLEPTERLRADHVLLVIEIVSPGSETTDAVDKLGEYAKSGIPHYWIARLDDTGVSVIERYQLDRATSQYKHLSTTMKGEPGDAPPVSNPVPITIDWSELEL
jgi:Uma2 family endonuclease